MTASMILPELTGGIGDVLSASAYKSGRAGGWAAEDGEAWIAGIQLVRSYVSRMREDAEGLLSRGVDARGFAKYVEQVIPILDRSLAGYARLEDDGILITAPAEVVSEFAAVRREMTACRELLADALTRVNAPVGAIDREKVRRARDAYAKGETKTVQEIRKGVQATEAL